MRDNDNPFFNRGPILDPGYFFGRREEIADIIGLIANMQNCSVVGGIKRGKTSLLLHLQRNQTRLDNRCDPDCCILPYLSLEGLANVTPEAFFHCLLREAVRLPGCPTLASAHERLSPVGELSFSELQATFDDFARAGVNVVFLLDEFELAGENPNFDLNFFSALRSLASRPNCAFVIATGVPLDQLAPARRSVGSPFADLFTTIRPSLFKRPVVGELVSVLGERAGRLWEVDLDRLMEWTYGHPYLVQLACSLLWRRSSGGDRPLTDRDYSFVFEELLDESHSYCCLIWALLSERQRSVILQAAAGRPASEIEDEETLQDLLRAELVTDCDGSVVMPSSVAEAFVQSRLREFQRGSAGFLAADRDDKLETINVAAPDDKRTIYKVVRALVKAAEARDQLTRGHSDGTARWAVMIAAQLGLSEQEIEGIKIAARLHDIGKIGVSDLILLKPEQITAQERQLVQAHVLVSIHILEALDFPWEVKPTVRFHHERLDGSGYPDGLIGDEIPLPARVLAVADVFDAMTSPRSHRPPHPREAALEEITRNAGAKYDRRVVGALLAVIEAPGA